MKGQGREWSPESRGRNSVSRGLYSPHMGHGQPLGPHKEKAWRDVLTLLLAFLSPAGASVGHTQRTPHEELIEGDHSGEPPRGGNRKSSPEHGPGGTKGRYAGHPPGHGERKSHPYVDEGPDPGVASTHYGYHLAPPTSGQNNLLDSGSPGTKVGGETSGSGFEDKQFRCRLRTAKIEQEAPSIGQESLERRPRSAITGICNSCKKLPGV